MPDFARDTSDTAMRFRRITDWFTVHRTASMLTLQVRANSERIVDLMHVLTGRLDSVVDVYVDHLRDGRSWHGPMRFLPEVREAIGRLRWPLAAYGGVELSLVTPSDQLTVTPALSIVIYSRRPAWPTWLEAEGLVQCAAFPPSVWTPVIGGPDTATDLAMALGAVATRLDLEGVS